MERITDPMDSLMQQIKHIEQNTTLICEVGERDFDIELAKVGFVLNEASSHYMGEGNKRHNLWKFTFHHAPFIEGNQINNRQSDYTLHEGLKVYMDNDNVYVIENDDYHKSVLTINKH